MFSLGRSRLPPYHDEPAEAAEQVSETPWLAPQIKHFMWRGPRTGQGPWHARK
ncbi:hypothetical protein K466DRAFT_592222 [Polyporus arcularius HHB13444]|uniref:Uncharacterized protein n=1 Tax=Polyporus arcularius HHB13444 TaxID=1314778 RepID=A0A5C3NTQ3_9APHY|nr:hypothetical protein K466DRAFT_592222 [Polyporus arcularius HHB13444]